MGGGSNSAPPSDVAPGGGTYPTNLFGQAYNPNWGSAQVGSAIQSVGQQGIQSSPVASYKPYVPTIQNAVIPNSTQPAGLIPVEQPDLLAIIQRILETGQI